MVIDASRETTLPTIKLGLASTTTSVNVTEDLETVQTANAENSTTISTKQIAKLPTLDRDVVSLISTQPGVASNGVTETVINGQRSSFSNVTLDGINIQDNFIRTGGLDSNPTGCCWTRSRSSLSSLRWATPRWAAGLRRLIW